MNKAFEDTQYNYADAEHPQLGPRHLYGWFQDSRRRRLNERMKELCEHSEVRNRTETPQMLEEVIHNQNLFTEEAITLTGDYYGLALSSYAIQAVGQSK